MSNTAPFILPVVDTPQEIQIQNFDFEKIVTFNTKIEICSQCENCIENNNIPFCSELNLPLSAAAEKGKCPIGKW